MEGHQVKTQVAFYNQISSNFIKLDLNTYIEFGSVHLFFKQKKNEVKVDSDPGLSDWFKV